VHEFLILRDRLPVGEQGLDVLLDCLADVPPGLSMVLPLLKQPAGVGL